MPDSYQQILVHLDSGRRISPALACARRLAAQHGAAIAAIDLTRPTLLTLPLPGDVGSDAIEALAELDASARKRVRSAFDEAMAGSGPPAQLAQLSELPMATAFARQALYADLLVLAQPDPQAGSGEAPADFNESVLAASGKPGVILPAVGPIAQAFDTIVMAWKPTREAARAVAGALPLLRRARQVHVLAWGPQERRGGPLGLEGYLQRHGVTARWQQRPEEPEGLGDLLLSEAFELGADLLVMGCYGHLRAREWILGGASRTVLRSMTLPVLMAH
jgi:nucleotide-binding universal stress UspA family protein